MTHYAKTENGFLLHHVSVIVSDTERSLAFYRDILGFQLTERPDLGFPGAWLSVEGGQQIHLMELDNPDPTTGRPAHGGRDRHMAFTVADIAPVRALLDEKNIPYTLSKSGRRALFCRDPDGNAIEIIERGCEARLGIGFA